MRGSANGTNGTWGTAVRLAGAAALAIAGASLGFAQGSPPRFDEVIEVPVVELELLAADRDGRPVDDLRLEEIRVFEDDRPVAIATFQQLRGTATAGAGRATERGGAAGAPAPDRSDRYVAIYLDEVHVGPASRRRLLSDLWVALDQKLQPKDQVMVALYDGSTHVVLPFSRDRKALRTILEDAGGVSTARLVAESERAQVLEMIYRDVSREAGNSPCLHAQAIVDGYLAQENHRIDLAIESFRGFVDSLSGIDGHKSIFHVSDGIPLRPGAEAQDYAQEMCSGFGASQGQAGSNFPLAKDIYDPEMRTLEDSRFDTTRRWRDIAARANSGNVTIYAFQADRGPNRFPGEAEQRVSGAMNEAMSRATANLQDPLFLVAEGTGGRALLGGDDLSDQMLEVLDEIRGQYVLTYAPVVKPGNEMRKIRVEVARAGVELRHRTLYRPMTLDDQIGNQLLGRLLYGDSAAPPSGFRLELGKLERTSDDLIRARFRLGMPLVDLGLTEKETGREGSFTAFVSVAAANGGTSAVRKAVVPVRIDAAAKDRPEQFVWEVEIVLRPGKQRLGVAVHDPSEGRTSFVVKSFDLDLPAASPRAAELPQTPKPLQDPVSTGR